jgi:hypothetical protein
LNHRDTENTEKKKTEKRKEGEEVQIAGLLLILLLSVGLLFFSSLCSLCLGGSFLPNALGRPIG